MTKIRAIHKSTIFCALTTLLAAFILSTCSSNMPGPTVDAKLSSSLDHILQEAVESRTVPGVVALVTNRDSVVYQSAFGFMDAEGNDTMRTDALFYIASMTKPITSLGVMMLAEDGYLALDDPVTDYIPSFGERRVLVAVEAEDSTVSTRPASRAVSVRDLLRHTSGLGYTFSSPRLLEWTQVTDSSALHQPLLHDPGKRWTYGSSTYFLGRIIEEVSGLGLSDFMETRILDPAGMSDTSFDLAESDSNRMAALYRHSDSILVGQPPTLPYQEIVRGDYGLLSTADDYGQFLRLVLAKGTIDGIRLVPQETIQTMTRNHLPGIKVGKQPNAIPALSQRFPMGAGKDGFGLGFQIALSDSSKGRAPGSLSWAGLYNTHFWIDPQNGLGVVLMTQVLPFYDERVMKTILEFEKTLYNGLGNHH